MVSELGEQILKQPRGFHNHRNVLSGDVLQARDGDCLRPQDELTGPNVKEREQLSEASHNLSRKFRKVDADKLVVADHTEQHAHGRNNVIALPINCDRLM